MRIISSSQSVSQTKPPTPHSFQPLAYCIMVCHEHNVVLAAVKNNGLAFSEFAKNESLVQATTAQPILFTLQ